MPKPRLHIHSDNSTWAGSENMPGIFLQSEEIREHFQVSFSFRYTPQYVAGMKEWVPVEQDGFPAMFPLKVPMTYCYKIRPYFKPIMALGYSMTSAEICQFYRLMQQLRPEVLHINNGGYPGASTCNSMAVAGRLAGVKRITYMVNSTTSNPWWYRWMTPLVKRSVSQFISASKHLFTKSHFLMNFNRYTPWVVIPNTVLWRQPVPKSLVREKLGLREDDVVFLGVGHFEDRKGFYRLVDAMDQIPMSDQSRVLVLSGEGPDKEIIWSRAAKSNSLVAIIPPQDIDSHSLINACDCLVVPSLRDEDFPNVVLIAMMYGRPVIASRLAGIPEAVCHMGTGLLCPPGDVAALAQGMEMMLNKKFRLELGANALDRFHRKYHPDIIIPRYIRFWEETYGA